MARISEAKLRSWMQKLGPALIALSTGICHDRQRAEDVVQEAFVKLWRQPPDAGEVVYPAWMRRVVTNLSINVLKRTKRPGALPEYSEDRSLQHDDRAAENVSNVEQMALLQEAMDRLDTPKRAILMLRAGEQLSYEQIAAHLKVPVGTVMSRLNRARAALMEELRNLSESDEPQVYPFQEYKHG